MPWKVLIADDDPNVREILRLYFRQQHIELIEAYDGVSALEKLEETNPDIVILDVMMPRMDGFETIREIMKRCEIPVIMLTAKNEEFDRVLGLEIGADDYITKPFSPRELLARMKAVFRRTQKGQPAAASADAASKYVFDDLLIHVTRREVVLGNTKIDLRPKEFELLAFLAKSPGSVFTREQLLQQVWGYEFSGEMRTVDVHIKKLREKLSPCRHAFIHTVWGVGYKFEVEVEACI